MRFLETIAFGLLRVAENVISEKSVQADRTTSREKRRMKKYYRQNKSNVKKKRNKLRRRFPDKSDKPGGVSGQERKQYGD